MAVYNNVLELIGNTPIVRCQRIDTGPCELYLKIESRPIPAARSRTASACR
jgi:cystathionine beta-synthase